MSVSPPDSGRITARRRNDASGKERSFYYPFNFNQSVAYHKPEGEFTEVSYMFVRPGPDKTPVQKVSFVTRVGDLGCGVGYYK
jgi:hypothetical protein